MKVIVMFLVLSVMVTNMYAQKSTQTYHDVLNEQKVESEYKMADKINVLNWLDLGVTPQFGNLFMTMAEAKQVRINLKDYFNDYDFGFNFGINCLIKKGMNLKALCNVGVIKFNYEEEAKPRSCIVQLTLDYCF